MSNEKKQVINEKKQKLWSVNPKKAAKIITILIAITAIILMTITNFAIDKNFNFMKWLSNATMLGGIAVFGLFMGESMGLDRQLGLEDGLYKRAIRDYNKQFSAIEHLMIYFIQWFRWFAPQELENKKVRILLEHGIDHNKALKIIKYCTSDDVLQLLAHPIEIVTDDGEKVLIGKIEEYQKDIVLHVLSGQVQLDSDNVDYYLTATGKSRASSVLERGRMIDKEISINKHSNRIGKLGFSLAISLIFGLFAIENAFGEGTAAEKAQIWVNLFFRLLSLFTAFVSGWASSIITVRLMAEKIDNKVVVLKLFSYSYTNKEFTPKTEEQLDREEYEAWKKKEEKAKENVIDPSKDKDKVEIVMEKPKSLENKSHHIEYKNKLDK